ncbi:CRISPR-associated protein (Cas_Csy1) [Thiothrix caldifontis]|uniref:CRISPR-associated protein (Cas_Csy1) n=1 Tax=Thiothrix caldifontis TaxID=525918 RepID=A0A1H4FMT2_9GAMM|nr:type I-F CRISPR-associated protein Csy1 [Thiothrix caldifontis]SEA98018.1 CRISPR-associated protein (Cas_Csy1) [Thiothrix caldifontis]
MQFDDAKIDLKNLPDLLTRYDSPLLQVANGELRQYLTALLNALFWKATKPKALFDESTAKQALQDEKRLQSLLGVAESALGTHNLKYPNANVNQGAVFEQNVARETGQNIQPWMSSHSVALTRTVGGAGNAAWAAEIRLLGTEFLLDGQRVRMADVLAQREGAVWDALLSLGLCEGDAEKLGGVLRQRLQQSDKGYLDRLSKQVFFPLRDDEDVVITPVQHFGLAREFHTRFFQRVKKENPQQERFQTRALKVGGANPINAGPYNAEIAGLYRHLLAEVPPANRRPFAADTEKAQAFEEHAQVLLARLRQRQTVFPLPNQLVFDDTFLSGEAIAQHGWSGGERRGKSNAYNRNTYQVAVDYMAEQLLHDATHLAEWLAAQENSVLLQPEFAQVSVLEKAWLDPRLRPQARLGADQVAILLTDALRLFKACQHHYQYQTEQQKWDKQSRILSIGDDQALRDSLATLIREF